MLDTIISSQTRLKLLIKFFLSEKNQGYLRGLEKEFHESSNSIRIELKKFIDAGLLISEFQGKKRYYKANPNHPMFNDLQQIVCKSVGINQILNCNVTEAINLEALFIIGKLARGLDSETIEMALVGIDMDIEYIEQRIKFAEKQINRSIMYMVCTPAQMECFFKDQPSLIIWKAGKTLPPKLKYNKHEK